MAGVGANGTLTQSTMDLLRLLKNPLTAEEISKQLGEPLFKTINRLREMTRSGLVAAYKKEYIITDKGKSVLQ
ncbi:MAG: hypothetical protein ACE5HO_20110 [bacterium]